MPMNNLIEYSDNHTKTSGNLWQYYRDEPSDQKEILNHSNKQLKTPAVANTKKVETAVPSKYFSNFWRTKCHQLIDLILTWSENCVISSAAGETRSAIKDTKLYVPAVTVSTEDNIEIIETIRIWF